MPPVGARQIVENNQPLLSSWIRLRQVIGTVLMGLRGSATAARIVVGGTAAIGFSDSTRSGGTFTLGSCGS
jgi:hypothetical protein